MTAETERPERCPTCGCTGNPGCTANCQTCPDPWHPSVSESGPPAAGSLCPHKTTVGMCEICERERRAPETAEPAREFLRRKGYLYSDLDKHPELLTEFAAERVAALSEKLEIFKAQYDLAQADLAEAHRQIELLEKRLRKYECPTCGSDQRFHRGWVGLPLHCSDEFHSEAGAQAEKENS